MDTGSMLEKIDKGVGTLLDWQEGADKRLKKLEAGAVELKTRVGAAEGSRKKSDEFAAELERRYEKARWDGTDRPGAGEPMRQFLADGTEVRIFRPQERVADGAQGERRGQLGPSLKSWITGQWPDPELRDWSGSSTSDGGILLSEMVSAQVIDLARAKSRVVEAGALTIPMPARDVVIPKVLTDPVAGWRAEGKAIPKSSGSLGAVMLRAHTLGVIVPVAVELLEDSLGAEALIERILAEAFAVELDRVALRGVGAAEEPLGLENTSGVGTATAVGTPNYDDFVDAQTTVRLANGEPGAAIVSPRDLGTLAKAKEATTNAYLAPPRALDSVRFLQTTQVPTTLGAGAESVGYVGDFTQMWIGIRKQITIEASRQAGDSTGSAFSNLQVWIRAYMRADVAVVRPNHFVVLSGITV